MPCSPWPCRPYLAAGLLALSLGRDQVNSTDPARPSARVAVRRVVAGLVDGARHVGERRPAAWGLAAIGSHRFFYGISTVAMDPAVPKLLPRTGRRRCRLGDVGTRLGVSGAGFLTAALATPVAARRMRKETWVTVLLAAAAIVGVVPGGPSPSPACWSPPSSSVSPLKASKSS